MLFISVIGVLFLNISALYLSAAVRSSPKLIKFKAGGVFYIAYVKYLGAYSAAYTEDNFDTDNVCRKNSIVSDTCTSIFFGYQMNWYMQFSIVGHT